MAIMLGVAKFEGARRASEVLEGYELLNPGVDWLADVAVLSRGKHGRISVYGTFGDRFFGEEESAAPIAGLSLGGATGMLVGALAGPAGMLAGGSLGAAMGGLLGAAAEEDKQPLYDVLRNRLENDSSALLLLADSARVERMLAAFTGAAKSVSRHTVRDELRGRLEEAIEEVASGAPPPPPGGRRQPEARPH